MTVEKLYASGLRLFLFLDVPPIEQSPLIGTAGSYSVQAEIKALRKYNHLLAAGVRSFSLRHRDAKVLFFDANKAVAGLLNQASSRGFKTTKDFCKAYQDNPRLKYDKTCPYSVKQYFWLNSLHPTSGVHRLLGNEIIKFLKTNLG